MNQKEILKSFESNAYLDLYYLVISYFYDFKF